MASVADARKAVAKTQENAVTTLGKMIDAMRPEVARALPSHMDPDRMCRIAITLLRRQAGLAECDAMSFLGALMTCAQLGLEPGPLGHAWIIPRKNPDTRVKEAHFQLGYKGAIELARRSGQLAKITARTVYQNEFDQGQFEVVYEGALERLTHKPILIGERGNPILYYAISKLVSGEEIFTPLRPEDVETRHRRRPQAMPDSPAWKNDYESMAWKSCIVEQRRWLPQSPELERAVAADGTVRVDRDPEVLDAPATSPDWIEGSAEDWPTTAAVPPGPDPDSGQQAPAGEVAK
jgi:recombination protein RecT